MKPPTNETIVVKPKLTLKKSTTSSQPIDPKESLPKPTASDQNKRKINQFKTLKLNPVGLRLINFTQNYYETLWNKLELIDGAHSEKKQCLKRLKESCSWMCKAIALYHQEKE